MSVVSTSPKEQKQLAVSVAVLEIIEREGLQAVTHSKVSRKSGVSRAWIYEYIGKERKTLITYAAEVFASYFARSKMTAVPKTGAELQLQLEDGINFVFDSIELSPVIIKLYFRFRGSDNPIGQIIQKYENEWLNAASKKIRDTLETSKEKAEVLAELILTLRLGFAHRLATAAQPSLVRERAREIFAFIHRYLDRF